MKLANIDMNSTEHDGSTGYWGIYGVIYGFDPWVRNMEQSVQEVI